MDWHRVSGDFSCFYNFLEYSGLLKGSTSCRLEKKAHLQWIWGAMYVNNQWNKSYLEVYLLSCNLIIVHLNNGVINPHNPTPAQSLDSNMPMRISVIMLAVLALCVMVVARRIVVRLGLKLFSNTDWSFSGECGRISKPRKWTWVYLIHHQSRGNMRKQKNWLIGILIVINVFYSKKLTFSN